MLKCKWIRMFLTLLMSLGLVISFSILDQSAHAASRKNNGDNGNIGAKWRQQLKRYPGCGSSGGDDDSNDGGQSDDGNSDNDDGSSGNDDGNSGNDDNSSEEGQCIGQVYTGGEFHLGPVDWQESEWHNAFSPYPEKIKQIEGNLLAGVESSHWEKVVDACISVKTEEGKAAILRVITYGSTTPNSIDVSPEAYNILNSNKYPRNMSWCITECPDNGANIYYQFKTGSNQWWSAFWIRNVALPVKKVEVKNGNAQWRKLSYRESDGSFVDNSGYGDGSYTIRVTDINGAYIEDTLSPKPGGLYESSGQF